MSPYSYSRTSPPSVTAVAGFKHSDIFKNLGPNDKVALLMVHFGTTHDDTRVLTIETINKKAAQAFPGIEVREAYTSRA